MRRFLFSLLAVGVGFFIVAISAVSVGRSQLVGQAGAQDGGVDEVVESGEMEVEDSSGQVDYYLAYPGILPDHPLYFIKMLRDRVRLVFASSPESKVELLLLYADKRIGAAMALTEGGKASLGVSTAFKAETYLSRVADELEGVGDEGLWRNVGMAGAKHAQVLEGIASRLEGSELDRLQEALVLNKGVLEKVGEVVKMEVMEEEEVEGDEGEIEEVGGDEEDVEELEVGL